MLNLIILKLIVVSFSGVVVRPTEKTSSEPKGLALSPSLMSIPKAVYGGSAAIKSQDNMIKKPVAVLDSEASRIQPDQNKVEAKLDIVATVTPRPPRPIRPPNPYSSLIQAGIQLRSSLGLPSVISMSKRESPSLKLPPMSISEDCTSAVKDSAEISKDKPTISLASLTSPSKVDSIKSAAKVPPRRARPPSLAEALLIEGDSLRIALGLPDVTTDVINFNFFILFQDLGKFVDFSLNKFSPER